MQWLKENFITFSIHKQIQIGILSVSLCVCFLVLGLIALNSFILLNLSYQDALVVLELKENQQIDSIATFVDCTTETMKDFTRAGVQYIRNMVTNLGNNQNIANSYTYINTSKVIRPLNVNGYSDCGINNTNCILYQNFTNYTSNPQIDYYNKILTLAFPLIRSTQMYRFLSLENVSISTYFQFFEFQSYSHYFYPYSQPNTSYTLYNYMYQRYAYLAAANITYFQNKQQINNPTDNSNIY